MAVKDIFKISRKTFFNPREWIGYNAIKKESNFVWQAFKNVFRPVPSKMPETPATESFTAALRRLNITETEVQKTAETYGLFIFFFGMLALFTLILALRYFWYARLSAGFISLGLTLFLLAQTFR